MYFYIFLEMYLKYVLMKVSIRKQNEVLRNTNARKLEDDTAEYYSRASTTISIYTTSCEILWSKNIEKRQKYTFANKLNNYSREADIK